MKKAKTKKVVSIEVEDGFADVWGEDLWQHLSVPGFVNLINAALNHLSERDPAPSETVPTEPEWPEKVVYGAAWREIRRELACLAPQDEFLDERKAKPAS